MPYCPKCDMEFVNGVTSCSDCGGPLVESKEAYEAELAARQEETRFPEDIPEDTDGVLSVASMEDAAEEVKKQVRVRPATYVKKSQQYEDRKSSASAFFLVGAIVLAAAVLTFTGIVPLPMAGFSAYLMQGVLAVMGIGCLVIAVNTLRSAKGMAGEIAQEEERTRKLVDWFLTAYRKEDIDGQLLLESPDLTPEELGLKRFELLADLFTTNHDLPDQAYVDALCEEVYAKLFEEESDSSIS